MNDDELARATTDALLDAVGTVFGLAGDTKMPARAILIYEVLDEDGGRKFDWVATTDLGLTDIIGMSHAVRQSATAYLLDEGGED